MLHCRWRLAGVAALSLLLLGLSGGAVRAQTPTRLPIMLDAKWDNYLSTGMDVDYTGIAFLSTFIHTGPAEYAVIRFTPTSNTTQVQGDVLYDTGLIWSGAPIDGVQSAFTAGDTLAGVLIPDLDELVLTGGSGGQAFTLCGPNAPKQTPSPTGFADTKICGQT
jgi:hypothetical protein